MKSTKRKNNLLILLLLLLFISVGYAMLTTTININGTSKVKNAKWDVHFENVQVTIGSVSPTSVAAIAEGETTTVNYGVTLTNPGDFYEFTVDAVNKGSIDAMVATITNNPLTEAQQKYLAYTVSYIDGTEIEEKHLLAANKKETLKVRVEFKNDVTAADLPTVENTLTLAFSVDYAQADSTAVAALHPVIDPVCRRATTLHTEVCQEVDGTLFSCSSGGYSKDDTVTYGKLGTAGADLEAGDALDCDVNGDGTFDEATERFYYVSDLDTNSNYAVLVYYNNVAAGVANNNMGSAYDSECIPKENGPKTAVGQLPTTEQWKKVSLYSTTRKIKDEKDGEYIDFNYAGRAARMLTTQEVEAACGITVGSYTIGELDGCQFLMENTYYTSPSLLGGYWLENVLSSLTYGSWHVGSDYRRANSITSTVGNLGVRPAIEVLKYKIAS